MITNIEDYFFKGCGRCDRFATTDCSTRQWSQGIADLRKICLGIGLVETLKWGHPCYMYSNRNVAIIGALRNDFRLSFFDAALMKDPKHVLERQGKNTPHPDMLRFTDNQLVTIMKPVIESYLREAIEYARQGIKPPKQNDKSEIELPIELLNAFKKDQDLAIAFHKLTPGRQRSYTINLMSAVKSNTRTARIAKFRDKILAGKGLMER